MFADLWGVIGNTNVLKSDEQTSSVTDHLDDETSSMIEKIVDRLGPFLMSVKEKFDSYAAKEGKQTISRQHSLGARFILIILSACLYLQMYFA